MSDRDAFRARIAAAIGRDFRMTIAGETAAASDGAGLATGDPATGETLCTIPDASRADIDRAVSAAREGQREWGRLTYAERSRAVRQVADVLRGNADLFGLLDTLETGNVYGAMRRDAGYGADAIDYLAGVGLELKGEATQLDGNLHYTRREPFGVALRLLPFNHPIMSAGAALAAPLLTGNAVILKPSPHSSLSALLLGELIAPLFPAGVVSVISGSNERAAAPLVTHEGIDRISLIGSTEAGRAVMRAAAGRVVPLTLELGGKNPMIVLPDADLDLAADTAVANMNFAWQSASCGSTSRILAHASVRAELERRLAERLAAVRVADPFDAGAEMGAISFPALYQRCLHFIDAGRREGARLVQGGERPSGPGLDKGLFVTPALFADATPDMSIAREEIFGPVLTLLEWTDRDELIRVANGLPHALTAVIIGRDMDAVLRTAHDVHAGYVEVNGPISWAPGSPFGGMKQSGFGREGNMDELLSYTTIKSVNIRLRG